MKMLRGILLLTSIFIGCHAIGNSPDIFELTETTFDYTSSGTWLVEFYAPWCGICKKLAPTYADAAEELRTGSLKFAKVDGTVETNLKSRFDVKGFPTILIFRNGEHRVYKGGRTLEDFIKFAEMMAKPPTSQVTVSTKALTNFREHPVSFVFSGPRGAESKLYETVATQLQGVHKFYTSQDKSFLQRYKLSGSEPQVVVVSEGGDENIFSGSWDSQEPLRQFIEQHRLPYLSWLSPQTFSDITSANKLICYTFVDLQMVDLLSHRNLLISVAKDFPDYVFATVDAAKFERFASQYKMDLSVLPQTIVFDFEDELYFSMQGRPGFSYAAYTDAAKISSFLGAVSRGEVEYTPLLSWYQPSRYWRMFNKFMNELNETQTYLLTGGMAVVFIVTTFGGLYVIENWLGTPDEQTPRARRKGGKQH